MNHVERTYQHWDEMACGASNSDQQLQRSRLEQSSASEVSVRELMETLTKRQKQVAVLIFNEYSNKQIAIALGTSTKTIEAHRKEAIRKLGCNSTIGLVKRVFPIMKLS